MPELGVDVTAERDGGGGLGADEFLVTLAEAVNEHRHGAAGHAELRGQPLVIARVGSRGQVGSQQTEGAALGRGRMLGLEAVHRTAEEGEGPLAVEVRRRVGGRGELVLVVRGEIFPGHDGGAATAFSGGAFLPLVTEEVAATLAEVAPEAALLAVGRGEEITLEQVGEKGLGEVLGMLGVVTQAPDKDIDRPLVGAA